MTERERVTLCGALFDSLLSTLHFLLSTLTYFARSRDLLEMPCRAVGVVLGGARQAEQGFHGRDEHVAASFAHAVGGVGQVHESHQLGRVLLAAAAAHRLLADLD